MWGEQLIKSWFSTFRAKDKQPTERVKKTILYSSRSNYYVINLVNCNKSITFAHQKGWFRSSVGLEQQPSKLWVLGSNPNGITNHVKRGFWKQNPLLRLERATCVLISTFRGVYA